MCACCRFLLYDTFRMIQRVFCFVHFLFSSCLFFFVGKNEPENHVSSVDLLSFCV